MTRQSPRNIEANIDYHTKLVKIYEKSQPHFRPENQAKVKKLLKRFADNTSGQSLLDLGCGTGFILELAAPYFKELVGVDITPAMLEVAEKKFRRKKLGHKIKLIETSTDKMPFSDKSFDVVTGYTFLHHLSSPLTTIKESYRVLKKGGIFYSDLDPNYYYRLAVSNIAKENQKDLSSLFKVDVDAICHMTKVIGDLTEGLDSETVRDAEYVAGHEGGFKEEEIKELFFKAGFKKVDLIYNWFWQEGKVIHDLNPKIGLYMEDHLRLALPLTRNPFKYFRIEAQK
ncbi:MAG: class I SAM-dependent methyltransferase [Patescibacteria group bacterium]|jgi:ubiquinone/menaquinone biosynthesis C-methylase UbiE